MQKKCLGLILIIICVLCGCGNQAVSNSGEKDAGDVVTAEREIFAMDTYMTLKAHGTKAEEAVSAAVEEIHHLDQLLSAEDEESEIYILNENGSEFVSEDTANLIRQALEFNLRTKGAFDITIYPLMVEWGFTTQKYHVPSKKRIEELLQYVDASKIEFDEKESFVSLPDHVKVDLGGIAKGYTSNRIMEIYKEYDLVGGLVSLGGNVQTYGTKPDGEPWNVAVQYPNQSEGSEEYLGILSMKDGKAVITSGGYERYFEQDGKTWHHILNPETGYSAESGLTSVTIMSEDGTLADGLSTSLFIMGKEKALSYWKENKDLFDVILMEEDGTITITEGVSGEFTSDYDFNIYEG